MSWFGGSSEPEKKSYSEPVSSFNNEQDFSSPSIGGGGSMEQELMGLQQGAIVQAVIMKLTETAFATCVTKPSSSLSSSESACISAVTNKYLESSEFIQAKMMKGKH